MVRQVEPSPIHKIRKIIDSIAREHTTSNNVTPLPALEVDQHVHQPIQMSRTSQGLPITHGTSNIHNIRDSTTMNQTLTQLLLLPTSSRYNSNTMVCLMTAGQKHPMSSSQTVQLHIDRGANRSLSHKIDHLINVRNIKPYYMSSTSSNKDIKCTALGYLPWQSPSNATLLVKCFYCQQAADIIIAPSDIVLNDMSNFHWWTQHANLLDNKGYITFLCNTDHTKTVTYPLLHHNGLWYYHYDDVTDVSNNQGIPMVNRISTIGLYELYHARLGHPGKSILSIVHIHVDGTPKLVKPHLYKCRTCMMVNATKRAITAKHIGSHKSTTQHPISLSRPTLLTSPAPSISPSISQDKLHLPVMPWEPRPGENFHIDMGFVRGTKYSHKDEDGRLITSLDGFNSYLLFIDRAIGYFCPNTRRPRLMLL